MGHAVRQFEKEVSLILDQQQEKCFLTDALEKACDRLALQKMATAVSVESRAKIKAS